MRVRQASDAVIWQPAHQPPAGHQGDGWVLTPLRPELAESDYAAFRSCQQRLRDELDWNGWPPEGFSLQDNVLDLAEHYAEFMRREAYAYSVQAPEGCIGCIYLEPWGTGAQLAFWFVDAWLDRESHILTSILDWLDGWPVDALVLPLSPGNERTKSVLVGLGLEPCEGPPGHVSFRR